MPRSLFNLGQIDPRLADLIGSPFVIGGRSLDGIDCWGLILEAYRRIQPDFQLPDPNLGELPEGPWEEIPSDQRQPLDIFIGRDYHAGIYLGRGWGLHSNEGRGTTLDRMDVLGRAGYARAYLRPVSGVQSLSSRDPEKQTVTITTVQDPLRAPETRVSREISPELGTTVAQIAPEGYKSCVGPRGFLKPELWENTTVDPGDHWLFLPVSHGIETLIAIAIIAAAAALTYANAQDTEAEVEDLPPSNAFSFEGLRNTAAPYLPIPSIYGERRTAGNYISAFYRVDASGVSNLHLLSSLSQGPVHSIAGIADEANDLRGTNIPEEIRIEDNPASYYEGVQVSLRQGTAYQAPTLNFDETTLANDIGVVLENDEPIVFDTQQPCTSVEVFIEFPDGLGRLNDNGTPKRLTWSGRIRVEAKNGTAAIERVITVTRKHYGATFSHSVRFDFRNSPRDIYTVTVTRLSPAWPDTGTKKSKSILKTINEINAIETSHPGLALMSAIIPSVGDLSGKIPSLTTLLKGRYVWVWDGVSETDPDFTYEWSDNPAWCIMDAVLDPVNGLGRNGKATLNNIDLQAFKDWADYCDTTPDVDGEASEEPRARLDWQMDEGQDAWDTLQKLAKCAWGRLIVIGEKISVILDKIKTPVALFNEANCSNVRIDIEAASVRPNRVEVEFENEEADYSIDLAPRQDDTAILTNDEEVRSANTKAPGVTRPVQAARLAQFWLNKHRGQLTQLTFETGLEAANLLPGDVFYFSHRTMRWGVSGRIVSATSDTVTLDRDVIASDGDKIMVRTHGTGEDVLQERTLDVGGSDVTVAAGDPITLTSAWDGGDVPAGEEPWSLGEEGSYVQTYEVTRIATEQRQRRTIEAVEYSEDFYDDDPGEIESFTDQLPVATLAPSDITNIQFREYSSVGVDGSLQSGIDLFWDKSQSDQQVDIYWRDRTFDGETPDDDDWIYVARTKADTYSLRDLPARTVLDIALASVSPLGVSAGPRSAPKVRVSLLGDRKQRPSYPSGLQVKQHGESLILRLPRHTNRNVILYDIRWGSTLGCSKRLGLLPPGDHSIPLPTTGATNIIVRPLTQYGVIGGPLEDPATITVTPIPGLVYEDIDQDEQANDFPGTKSDLTFDTDRLKLDVGSSLTGYYETGILENVDGIPRENKPFLEFEPGLEETEAQCGECPFPCTSDLANRPADEFYLTGLEHTEATRCTDLIGVPSNGLIADLMKCDGNHVDVVDYCEPTIELAISEDGESGIGGYETFIPGERTLDSLQFKITLQSPHARLIPNIQKLAVKATYNKEPLQGSDLEAAGFVGPVYPDRPLTLIWSDDDGSGTYEEERTLFTLIPDGEEFCNYYSEGVRYTLTENLSIQISDTTGLHMIYLDEDKALKEIVNPSNAEVAGAFGDHAIPAFVYWNSTTGKGIVFEEMHRVAMDTPSHIELHYTIGFRYTSGFGLDDIETDESGDDASHAQFTIEDGVAFDEDVQHDILGFEAGDSSPDIPILWRDADGWNVTRNSGFPVLTTGTGRLAYNDPSTGLEEVDNADFVLCHIFATNILDSFNPSVGRVVAIVGQNEYNTLGQARDGATAEILELLLGDLPAPEMTPLWTVVYQTNNGYSNAVKGRTRTAEGGGGPDALDFRGLVSRSIGNTIATSEHGVLSGLLDDDHTQYLLIDGTRSMSGNLDLGGNFIESSGTLCGILDGSSNTSYGLNALANYASGSSNTAIGNGAGRFNQGNYNFFGGRNSGLGTGVSHYNVVIGGDAMPTNGNKLGNVVLGYQSSSSLAIGNYSIVIGYQCDTARDAGNECIIIGRGMGTGSGAFNYEFILGSSGASSTPLLRGDLQNGYLAIGKSGKPSYPLEIALPTDDLDIVDAYELDGSSGPGDAAIVVRINGTSYKILLEAL